MKTATLQLIELAEHLNPTGVIGDGMVATFHELAARARIEQGPRQSEPFVYCAPCHQSATAPGFVGCSKPGCPLSTRLEPAYPDRSPPVDWRS